MNNSISITCGPDNDKKLLQIGIPENNDPLNIILVGFTGGLDSSFLLYLLAKLNSLQPIPYVLQPITITGNDMVEEQWQYLQPIIDLINNKTNQSLSMLKIEAPADDVGQQLTIVYSGLLRDSLYHKFLYLGDTLYPVDLNLPFPRSFPSHLRRTRQPFKNLNKSHIIDAILQLELEELINIAPRCPVGHKYGNEPCSYAFCVERRWAYSLLNKTDLLTKFISKDI